MLRHIYLEPKPNHTKRYVLLNSNCEKRSSIHKALWKILQLRLQVP